MILNTPEERAAWIAFAVAVAERSAPAVTGIFADTMVRAFRERLPKEAPKPSPWADAPKWARFRAQDKSGAWWWYECMPQQDEHRWAISQGEAVPEYSSNWRKTLETRPEGL